MLKEQAIAIASADARKLDIDLAQFSDPTAHYACDLGSCTWTVNFRGRDQLAMGNHFGMQINDSSCSTVLQPGL